jgi:hypothetical protein
LKENFDRFNFAIYKEKEMADFRRLFTALALVALFVGLASAQGGLNGGSTMQCSSTTTVTPQVRSEGFTELTGDVLLNCTGGSAITYGAQIPQANITVFLNTQVTSRVLSINSQTASEALLMIDEPGSTTVSGYGAGLAQSVCTTPSSGCVEFVGNNPGTPGAAQACAPPGQLTGCGVPSNVQPVNGSGGSTTAFSLPPNVFMGVVNGNSVTFFGVPILPPSSTGSRIYRITNVRANANGISGGGATPGSITGSVSISPSNAFTINQPLNTLAFVNPGLSASLRNITNSGSSSGTNFNQCSSAGFPASGGNVPILRFGENFPTAFKTRVALVNGNTNPIGTGVQNTPGQVYNSESGFIEPAGAFTTAPSATPGLADWGTRLKAVFSNIPSGVSVFVSTLNVTTGTVTAPVAAGTPQAALLISETVPDTNTPATATATVVGSTGNVNYAPVTIVNGSGVAVWEVLSNNYTTNQNFDFGVFLTYSASPGTNNPIPGPMSVNLSLAPNPTNGAFSASSAANPSSVNLIPRFADTSSARTLATVNICQTALLFPFVTSATGFETGLAISNTTQDPFGTTPQTGSCSLSWYQAGTGGTNPPATTTPAVPGGTTFTTLASNATNAGANFTGYMIAICNFQDAHGYAAITDVGARGVFASYLALVFNGGRGPGAESLAH